jgi:hypothetical protein
MTCTKLNIGINVCGQIHVLIPKEISLPYEESFEVTTTSDYKSLEIYEGLYKDNEYNILLCNLDIPAMNQLTISLDISGKMFIKTGTFVSNPISLSCDKTIIEHITGYNARTDEWKQLEVSRMKYLDYIYETKDTLYDPYVKQKIHPDIYKSVIKHFKQAEQICYVKDVTLEEILTIHNEVECMVNKVLNDVVIENNGEFK